MDPAGEWTLTIKPAAATHAEAVARKRQAGRWAGDAAGTERALFHSQRPRSGR